MANICEKCGRKISAFSNTPLELNDGKFLCSNCAEPIREILIDLQYVGTKNGAKEEFDSLRTEVLEKSHELYSEAIVKGIESKLENIYSNTLFAQIERRAAKENLLKNFMLTTGYEFSGHKITRYIGVISGQVVLGTGFLSEFTASFADFFGEESNKFADKLETAKNAAVEKLIMKSVDKGGNAIIGVDFDYITFHGNMIGVVANGTSVVIEKNES